jgi:subfamily B ATP-binding cassette protein MsbA
MSDAAAVGFDSGSVVRVGIEAVRRHPWSAALVLVASIAQGALQGGFVWALRHVLLTLSTPSAHAAQAVALAKGAAIIIGVWSLRALSTYINELASGHMAHRVQIDALQRLFGRILLLSVRFFERTSQGDLAMTAFNDLRGVRVVVEGFGIIVLSVFRLLGLLVVAWLISPKLAAIGLLAVPLGLVPAYWLGRQLTLAAKLDRGAQVTLSDCFLELASGIRMVKVNSGEPRVMARARAAGRESFRHTMRQVKSASLARLLLELVMGFGLIAVLVVGGWDVGAGTLGWQSLMSLLIAIIAVYSPILNLLGVYSTMKAALPGLTRVAELMRTTPEVLDAPHPRPLRHPPVTIELEALGFSYGHSRVLDQVSARFQAGETIGIVGPSGAGKSTLLALMLRLYDPTRGRILLDGVDLREIRHGDLMAQCAIVLQEPFLFDDTIANNIRFTRPDASMDDVIAAARAAHIHDEIMATPLGYDTVIGRRQEGQGLSTGQKQRICIAAALLKNAPLLFLDEATSNLDSVSERKVQAAIEQLMRGRTTFVVAHRLSTLRTADRLLVLERGRLVGLGTHDHLLSHCAVYRGLWYQQHLGSDRDAGGGLRVESGGLDSPLDAGGSIAANA